ncbi:MAG TPA: hypothetical protein VGS58_12830 [Candidatus Sulfopaludibacter sp.]|nr:hypothetical protein [Candidatus Sulfopaludibacter sp.]
MIHEWKSDAVDENHAGSGWRWTKAIARSRRKRSELRNTTLRARHTDAAKKHAILENRHSAGIDGVGI